MSEMVHVKTDGTLVRGLWEELCPKIKTVHIPRLVKEARLEGASQRTQEPESKPNCEIPFSAVSQSLSQQSS